MEKTIKRGILSADSPYQPLPDVCWCYGLLDYIYGCWWRCRKCNRWHEHTPKP